MLKYDVLLFGIKRTSVWRRGLSDRFPDDARNVLAADMLDALAQTPVSEVDPALWAQVEPFITTRKSREAISIAARTVGFSERPRTLNDFLVILLDMLMDAVGDTPTPAGAAILPSAQVAR